MSIRSVVFSLSWLLLAAAATTAVADDGDGGTAPPQMDAGTGEDPRTQDDSQGAKPRKAREIVNGTLVPRGKYPFMVALARGEDPKELVQYCGGSMLNPRKVLTAAHCEVRSGDWALINRRDLTKFQGEAIRIATVTPHTGFNPKTFEHDIAILTLAEAVKAQGAPAAKKHVKLPKQGAEVATGAVVVAMGWGRTTEGGATSSILQEVSVPVSDHQACRERYLNPDPSFRAFDVLDAMLCASAPGKDTCQGDSGGPLVVAHGNGSFTQVGITSFGNGCARDYPGVYTRVSAYGDWINENLK